jgi:hypothetical protein
MLPDYTIFAIPRIQVRPRTDNDPPGPPGRKTFNEPIYEYAVIFSKYADHRGPKLLLPFPQKVNGKISIYRQFKFDETADFKPGRLLIELLGGKAESVFLVQKPFEIIPNARVTLHSCYDFGWLCPPNPENKNEQVKLKSVTFTLGEEEQKEVNFSELKSAGLLRNTRSIYLTEGQFVVWFGDPYDPEDYENFWIVGGEGSTNLRDMERCSNLDQDKLKKEDRQNSCAGGLVGFWQAITFSEVCVPCFADLTIIRGTAL